MEIANDYFYSFLKIPHMNCERATIDLKLKLEENNIKCKHVMFYVDMNHYNGVKKKWMTYEYTEHHCIKINRRILDVTASQFNNTRNEKMPVLYFGPVPIWYRTP